MLRDDGYNFLIGKTEVEKILDNAIRKMHYEIYQAITHLVTELVKENMELKRSKETVDNIKNSKKFIRKRRLPKC